MPNVLCGHCKGRHSTPYDVYLCSRGQTRRPAQTQVAAAPVPPRNRNPYPYPFDVPEAMLDTVREGRYAVDVGRNEQHIIFLRISRPTKGKYAGCFKVQTQHSDYYKEACTRWPNGRWWVLPSRKSDLNMALAVIAVNPLDAAILYAKEKGACSRCGRVLTDERSRYYSIGPECEKYWPDLIEKIDALKGPF